MKLLKNIHNYIVKKLKEEGALHFSLLDPVTTDITKLKDMINLIVESKSDAILVGGSTLIDQVMLSHYVDIIKKSCDLPVILFPNNVAAITSNADAIYFMSLLNSRNPYYIIGAQMLAAPYIKKNGPEPLSMAYLIIGQGQAAGFIGDANPIPYNKPELAAAYALTAEMFGFKYVYLEAGSGASSPISPDFVKIVRKWTSDIIIIVGGGIRDANIAYKLVKSGADVIVTGTVIEKKINLLKKIVDAIKEGGREKIIC